MTDDKDLVKAFLDHSEMEFIRSYLERGRSFADVPTEGVEEAWATAFKLACVHGQTSHKIELNDLTAELRLRGLDPPERLVQAAIKIVQERVRNLPEAASDALQAMISGFLDEMGKPKN